MPLRPEAASSLGMALVMTSSTPWLLLDETLAVQAASGSFCRAFDIDPSEINGRELCSIGKGEWDIPQLRSLLKATASGAAAIDCYEMDLTRADGSVQSLVLNAHVLDHSTAEPLRLVVALADVTAVQKAGREKDTLVREKQVLLQELNHRVANSLQIIASVLMQRVRKVQSEETRTHLRDAHNRVMSIAKLQRQLASNDTGQVALRPYLTELCASIAASMVADPAELKIVVEADDTAMSADRSTSVGLIVTELVINALKHAFPDEAPHGQITIGFLADTAEHWTLTVADNGVGFPGDNDLAKPGLGTGIVNALAGQLGAEVQVQTAHPGTRITITR